MMNFLNGFTYQDLDLASDTPLLIRNTTEIIIFCRFVSEDQEGSF